MKYYISLLYECLYKFRSRTCTSCKLAPARGEYECEQGFMRSGFQLAASREPNYTIHNQSGIHIWIADYIPNKESYRWNSVKEYIIGRKFINGEQISLKRLDTEQIKKQIFEYLKN